MAAALERGRWLFAQECGFVAGAATVEQIPPGRLAEVAFAGRSNVGKSSLINALTARRTLAKVSNTPGRTRQVNFFELGGRLMLTDLPGYGYARASKEQVANWTKVVDHYLVGRAPLRRALLLIDARHGVKDVDRAGDGDARQGRRLLPGRSDQDRPAQAGRVDPPHRRRPHRCAPVIPRRIPRCRPPAPRKGRGLPSCGRRWRRWSTGSPTPSPDGARAHSATL